MHVDKLIRSRGVLYHVSDSYEFVEECIYSLKTFKKFHPEIPVTLITNLTINEAHQHYFENIITLNVKLPKFVYKVYCLQQSPYDYTLFLDVDTEIRQTVYEMFDFLDYYDFVFTKAIEVDFTKEKYEFISYMDERHCNSGVILFKNTDKSERFLNKWLEVTSTIEFERTIGEKKFMSLDDQMSLNYLLRDVKYQEEIKMRVLYLPGKVYNAVTYTFHQFKKDGQLPFIKIAHGHELYRQQLKYKIKDKLSLIGKKYFQGPKKRTS